MALLGAPHGLHGWLRASPFVNDVAVFQHYSRWWCAPADDTWRRCEVSDIRPHGERLLLKIAGVDSCEDAVFWRHGKMAVAREDMPSLSDSCFYWCDLIGLRVLSVDGRFLGNVAGLMPVGDCHVLRVAKDKNEILIPFIDDYVPSVDITDGSLQVDWQPEW